MRGLLFCVYFVLAANLVVSGNDSSLDNEIDLPNGTNAISTNSNVSNHLTTTDQLSDEQKQKERRKFNDK